MYGSGEINSNSEPLAGANHVPLSEASLAPAGSPSGDSEDLTANALPGGAEFRDQIKTASAEETVVVNGATISKAAKELHDRATVVDIHSHPCLKVYLLNKELHKSHWTPGFTFPFTLRTNLPSLKAGGVNVLLSSLYAPERGLYDDCWPIRAIAALSPHIKKTFNTPADEITRTMMTQFEAAVLKADKKIGPYAEVVKSQADLTRAIKEGKLAIVHSIEGAHSLAGKIENVEAFFNDGVSYMILAHLCENDVVGHIEGIPDDYPVRKVGAFKKSKADINRGLTPFGRDVVTRMSELGMIVDLTHTTPVGRQEIYELNKNRRPIIMSHVGVRDMYDTPMNPDKAEVKQIADTGGVIGVIAMNYWLIGEAGKNGIDNMVETMKFLVKYGGDDCVSIGSDFDGFTNPPNDLVKHADLPKLTDRMLKHFPSATVEKILGQNFLRVLKEGWGKKE